MTSYLPTHIVVFDGERERESAGGVQERAEAREAQPWCGPERDNCWGQRWRLGD